MAKYTCKIPMDFGKWLSYPTDNKYIYQSSDHLNERLINLENKELQEKINLVINFKDEYACLKLKALNVVEDINPKDYYGKIINSNFNGDKSILKLDNHEDVLNDAIYDVLVWKLFEVGVNNLYDEIKNINLDSVCNKINIEEVF